MSGPAAGWSWATLSECAPPIDWVILDNAVEAARKATISSVRGVPHLAKDPALSPIVNFIAFAAGAAAFWTELKKAQVSKEANAQRPSDPEPEADLEVREAATLLGVKVNASVEEIKAAHRAKITGGAHPDHGGNTELAQRMNVARDVLIKRAKEKS